MAALKHWKNGLLTEKAILNQQEIEMDTYENTFMNVVWETFK